MNGSLVQPEAGLTVSIWELSKRVGLPKSKSGAMIHRLLPMVLEEHVLVAYSLCLLDILILLLRFAEDLGNQQHQW